MKNKKTSTIIKIRKITPPKKEAYYPRINRKSFTFRVFIMDVGKGYFGFFPAIRNDIYFFCYPKKDPIKCAQKTLDKIIEESGGNMYRVLKSSELRSQTNYEHLNNCTVKNITSYLEINDPLLN